MTLALSASPDISSTPTDIVLVLDRSGSMAGSPLTNMKNGAKKFIDIIDEATDSSQDGQIGSGSRIGIVSFADTATQNTQLITSVDTLKTAVDSLSAGGSTNHADAFTKAAAMFDPNSTNGKVIVMFTDGKTTAVSTPAQSPRQPAPPASSSTASVWSVRTASTRTSSTTGQPTRTLRTSPSPRTTLSWRTCSRTWRRTSPSPAPPTL